MLKDKKIVRRLALLLCLSLLVGLVPTGILSVPFQVNAVPGNSTNLLANGSFESGKDGWNGGAAIEIADADVSDGAHAAVIPAGSGIFYMQSDKIAVVPGETYHLSAMAKRLSGEKTGYVGIWYVDANGAYVGDGAKAMNYSADVWTEVTMDWTVPAGVAFIWIEFGVNSNAESSFVIDNIVLTKTSAAPEATEATGATEAPGSADEVLVFEDNFEGTFAEKWDRTHTHIRYWSANADGKPEFHYDGKSVLLLQDYTASQGHTVTTKAIAAAPGKAYTLSYQVRDHWAAIGDSVGTIVKMYFVDASGNELTDATVTAPAITSDGTNWAEVVINATAPANAASLHVAFTTPVESKNVICAIDALTVTESGEAAPVPSEPEASEAATVIFEDGFENAFVPEGKPTSVRIPNGWTPNKYSANIACAYYDKYEGKYTLAVQSNGYWMTSSTMPAAAGKTYTATFMEKKYVVDQTATGGYFKFVFVDADGNILKEEPKAIGSSTAWTEITHKVVAPAGTAGFYVEFGIKDKTGGDPMYSVDNLKISESGNAAPVPSEPTPSEPKPTETEPTPSTPAVSGSVVNGGFEDGLNGWNVQNVMSQNDDKHSGNASLKFAVTEEQGARFTKQVVSVIPGKTYTLSAWVKILDGKGGYIGLYGIGGSNAAVGFGNLEIGQWTKVSLDVTIPYGYEAVEVEFGTNSKQIVTFLLDDIDLIETDAPPAPTEPEVTVPTEPEGEKIYEEKFENAFNPEGAAATVRVPVGWTASVHSAAIGIAMYDQYDGTMNLCVQDAKDKWIKSPLIEVKEGYEYTATYVEHKYQPTKKGAGGYAKIVFVDKDGNFLKEYSVEAGQTKIWEQGIILSKAPAGATHMYVEFGLLAPSGEPTYSVDNLAVYAVEASLEDEEPTKPTEPVKPVDPMKPFEDNFENPAEVDDLNAGPAGWICNDDSVDAFGTMITLVNNSLSFDGNYLRLGKTGTWTATTAEFPVQIGYSYTVKFMARKLVDNTNFNGSVEIVFVNTRGKIVETFKSVAGKTYGEWAEESLSAVAPIGAYKAYVVLTVDNTDRRVDADFAVDNFAVVRAEEPTFDYDQEATEPIIYNPVIEDTFTESYRPDGSASTVRVPVGWTSSIPGSAAIGVGTYDKYEGTATLFIQNKGDKFIRSDVHAAKAGYNYLVSYVEKKYQPHITAEGGYMRIVFVDAAGNMIAQFEEKAGSSKTWTDMEYEYTAPAGATGYYIEFGLKNCSGGDPTYGVDNLVIYESESQVSEPSAPEGTTPGGSTTPENPEDNTNTGDNAALMTVSVMMVAVVALAVLVLKKLRFI